MASIRLLPDEPRYCPLSFPLRQHRVFGFFGPEATICNLEITDSFSTHEASTSQRAPVFQPALRQSAGKR
jgi:hypothetical protein